ncbi:hypothetical protein ALP06_200098 [Pseudomonas coronafaciens pv. atropurpurea]|nr:hypothetical protein ALP06_200098 [Pseudomonas coronafaciens pv. atropurpurea]
MYYRPTLDDVCRILIRIDMIPRPYGDNEGDAINSDSVYPYLSSEHQTLVDEAVENLHTYTRVGGEPDNRSITYLCRRGYSSALNPAQDDLCRLLGYVKTTNWIINISDAFSY